MGARRTTSECMDGWRDCCFGKIWENLGKLQGYLGEREEYMDTFFPDGRFVCIVEGFFKKKKRNLKETAI